MTVTFDTTFIAALATLLTAIAGLYTAVRANNRAQATQRVITDVHEKVNQATNGQHDELVNDLKDLKQQVQDLQSEVNTLYKAFVEQIERRRPHSGLRLRKEQP